MELRVTQWVAIMTPMAPRPTPTTAVMSGMPAATSEPKVKTSTMNATARPMISDISSTAMASPKPAPPPSTVSPCSRPSSIAAVTTSLSSCFTEFAESASKSKVVYAMVSSSLTIARLSASARAVSSGRPIDVNWSMTLC